jgi:hypothetical protein
VTYARLIALAKEADRQVAAPLRAEAQRRGDPLGALLAALLQPDAQQWPKLCAALDARAAEDSGFPAVARRIVSACWGETRRVYEAPLAALDAALARGPSLALALSDGLYVTSGEPAEVEDARWARVVSPEAVAHLTSLHVDEVRSPLCARSILRTGAFSTLSRLALCGGLDPCDLDALLGALPPTLRDLDLSWNKLSDEALAAAFRHRPTQAALTSLDLSGNQGAAGTARALTTCPATRTLQALNLTFNELDAAAIPSLIGGDDPASALFALADLGLSGNHIGYEGTAALAASALLTRLTALDLSWCSVADEGVLALAQTAHPTALVTLNLLANRVGSRGARALAESQAFPALETLNISGNPVGAAAITALRASPHLSRLRRLRYDR